jgi:hypothetical protein
LKKLRTNAEKFSSGAWRLEEAAIPWRAIIRDSRTEEFNADDPKIVTLRDQATTLIQAVIEPLMIRRTERTELRGQTLVRMPRHEHRDVYASINQTEEDIAIFKELTEYTKTREDAKLAELQKAWDIAARQKHNVTSERPTSISPEAWLKAIRQSRFYACFPYLLRCGIPDNHTTSTFIEKCLKSDDTEKECWAYKYLDEIGKSPKIRCLAELLDTLQPDEPLVGFAANPAESFVQYMVMHT